MSHKSLSAIGVALMFVSYSAPCMAQESAPWRRPGDLLLADTSADVVYRLADLNLDGDFSDAGEITVFFSSGTGGYTLPLMVGIAVGPDGAAFVCDTTSDLVIRLQDLNGDGDALDAGEATTWFGSSGSTAPNASALNVPSMLGIAVSAFGEVYVANSGTAAAPTDGVIRLVDLNGDGDAQDAGEAAYYATTSTSATGNNSVPSSVAVGPDGLVYYGESGAAAGVGRGVWRLADLTFDNDCDDAGEKTLYYQPPFAVTGSPPPTAVGFYGLAFDATGRLLVSDHTVDTVFAVVDLNGDLSVAPGTAEESTFFVAPTASLIWSLAVGKSPFGDVRVFATEDQAPERIHLLADLNLDGDATDAGEATLAYDDASASVNFDGPRAVTFMKGPSLIANPLPAVIGQNFTVTCSAGAGELFVVEVGLPLPFPVLLPPLGALYLDPTPGTYFDLVPAFIMPASGEFSAIIPIPNFPPLTGITLVLQGLGGAPSRLFTTNGITVTFV